MHAIFFPLPVPTGDLQFTVSPRDTAVVLKLSPALPYQHFDTFFLTWHQERDSGTIYEANVSVEEGGMLFLEGLRQGQRYIGNWNGNSSFQFKTTKYGISCILCMYVCMYVSMYIYYMYVCTYICMYVCMYVCIYVCMYVCVYVCTYMY